MSTRRRFGLVLPWLLCVPACFEDSATETPNSPSTPGSNATEATDTSGQAPDQPATGASPDAPAPDETMGPQTTGGSSGGPQDTCTSSTECDDGDPCNGVEECESGRCVAAQPLNCDDGDPCTHDACDPLAGCVTSDIDEDNDGFGPGECGGDCNDGNPLVFPGQTEHFPVPIPGTEPELAFDYNCDGIQSRRWTATSTCYTHAVGIHCNADTSQGWDGPVPDCGQAQTFGTSCVLVSVNECEASGGDVIQECR